MPLYNPTASGATTPPLVLDTLDYPNETPFWIGKTGGTTRATIGPSHTDLNTLVMTAAGGLQTSSLTAPALAAVGTADVVQLKAQGFGGVQGNPIFTVQRGSDGFEWLSVGGGGTTSVYTLTVGNDVTAGSTVAGQRLAYTRTDGGGYIEGVEQTADPAAPAANTGRIFFKDNGSGKTQLAVRFPTGATQIVATEP